MRHGSQRREIRTAGKPRQRARAARRPARPRRPVGQGDGRAPAPVRARLAGRDAARQYRGDGMTELLNLSDATVIKAGNSFCVALRDGRMPQAGDHPLGVYLHDCRYLRSHELWLDGQPPRLLIASDEAGSAAVFEFTNSDLVLASGQTLPLQSLRVRLERRMEPTAMLERITLRSHA